ncbi:unnamed protein product [Brugia timori]|uniref:Transcriptional regulator n=1 Tax=Brugia timori TaxID=42155 RepID=A0A0R3QGH7_9BILA|nr:unnamed protein product [Brugia timori]
MPEEHRGGAAGSRRQPARRGARDLCAAERRRVRGLLAGAAQVLRRGAPRGDDDLGGTGRSAHEDRDRGDGAARLSGWEERQRAASTHRAGRQRAALAATCSQTIAHIERPRGIEALFRDVGGQHLDVLLGNAVLSLEDLGRDPLGDLPERLRADVAAIDRQDVQGLGDIAHGLVLVPRMLAQRQHVEVRMRRLVDHQRAVALVEQVQCFRHVHDTESGVVLRGIALPDVRADPDLSGFDGARDVTVGARPDPQVVDREVVLRDRPVVFQDLDDMTLHGGVH